MNSAPQKRMYLAVKNVQKIVRSTKPIVNSKKAETTA